MYAAGLKVGEAMARARLAGANFQEAQRYAAEHSLAVNLSLEGIL